MTRRAIALLLVVVLLLLFPAQGWAQGNCGVFSTYGVNDTVTASNLNSNFTQAAQTNDTFACLNDYSGTVGQMQSNTDPYASQTESLATTGAGELERLRYVLRNVFGFTQWYIHTENVNFGGIGVTRTGIQGAGLGAHVTAVGLHTWSGSARFPAITSTDRHTTGIFWPAAHHMAISIDRAVDADKTGVEMVRFHAAGIVLHHTAAIMFRHSLAGQQGVQSQTGHITALSIFTGYPSQAGNEAPWRDTIVVGHAGAGLWVQGGPGSHIALGSHSYIALGRHIGTLNAVVLNALYADTMIKAWGVVNQTTANHPILGGFNLAGVTDAGVGLSTFTWDRDFLNANYSLVASCGLGLIGAIRIAVPGVGSASAGCFNTAGTDTDGEYLSVIAVGPQ